MKYSIANYPKTYCFLFAVFLTAIFFASLHPVTGGFGGFIFLFTSWYIPTLVPVLLSYLIATLLFKNKFAIILSTIIISAFLCINNRIVYLIQNNQKNIIHEQIIKKFDASKGFKIIRKGFDRHIYVPHNPLLPLVAVGSNEGCMCMYFTKFNETFFKKLDSFRYITCKSGCSSSFLIESIDKNPEFLNIKIDLQQNGQSVAVYEMKHIPYVDIYEKIVHGEDNNLLNGHFWENAIDIFLHNNVWSYILYPLVKKNDLDGINDFYARAMVY